MGLFNRDVEEIEMEYVITFVDGTTLSIPDWSNEEQYIQFTQVNGKEKFIPWKSIAYITEL